jgi:tRNA (mo5U34)-methyltransferase
MALVKEKRIRVGGLEFAITMDAARAERLRKSPAYARLIRPALDRLQGASNGHAGRNGTAWQGVPPRLPQMPAPATPEARAILDRIAGVEWYHTIDLPHGVTTPGFVDHRSQRHLYGLPDDMRGMRVLEVACFDGFWSFEFERRGAEVVAIDLASTAQTDIPRNWMDVFYSGGFDKPKGEGFRIAKELLGSKVRREVLSVHDLGPEHFGEFDMAFCSDVLLHLRDPLRAMENIWRVTKQFAIFADVYNPELEAFKNKALTEFCMVGETDVWWRPSSTTLYLMLHVARFSRVEEVSRFKLNSHFEGEIPKVVYKAYH